MKVQFDHLDPDPDLTIQMPIPAKPDQKGRPHSPTWTECRLFHLEHWINDGGGCEASVGDILGPNWILFSGQRDSFVSQWFISNSIFTAHYSTLLPLLPLKFRDVRGSWLRGDCCRIGTDGQHCFPLSNISSTTRLPLIHTTRQNSHSTKLGYISSATPGFSSFTLWVCDISYISSLPMGWWL